VYRSRWGKKTEADERGMRHEEQKGKREREREGMRI
jgi:hypothetical protein